MSLLQYLAHTAYGSQYIQPIRVRPVTEEFVKCDNKIDFILSLTYIQELHTLLYNINYGDDWELYNAFVTKFNELKKSSVLYIIIMQQQHTFSANQLKC